MAVCFLSRLNGQTELYFILIKFLINNSGIHLLKEAVYTDILASLKVKSVIFSVIITNGIWNFINKIS